MARSTLAKFSCPSTPSSGPRRGVEALCRTEFHSSIKKKTVSHVGEPDVDGYKETPGVCVCVGWVGHMLATAPLRGSELPPLHLIPLIPTNPASDPTPPELQKKKRQYGTSV